MTYGTLPPIAYPATSKLLHWLIAICVLTTIPVGVAMGRVAPGPTQDSLFNFHKAIGVVIFVLMVLRLLNRLAVGAPAPEPGLARWQRAVSSAVHGLIYLLLLTMPIVGYLGNSAFGATTPMFGLFEIPPIIGKNEELADGLFRIHRLMGFAVAGLAAMHIAAALQHAIILRDGVLQRMLPRALGGR